MHRGLLWITRVVCGSRGISGGMSGLATLLNEVGEVPEGTSISRDQALFLRDASQYFGWNLAPVPSLRPVNCPAVLLLWRVQAHLLNLLSVGQRATYRRGHF